MAKKYLPWKLFVACIGLYHLFIGIVLLASGDLAIKLAGAFAGMTVIGTPELGIMGEILATYIIAFGLLMLAAAWDPEKNRAAISIGIVLFGLRLFQRMVFAEKMMTVFHIPSARYWSAFVVVAVMGIALGAFRYRIYSDMHGIDA